MTTPPNGRGETTQIDNSEREKETIVRNHVNHGALDAIYPGPPLRSRIFSSELYSGVATPLFPFHPSVSYSPIAPSFRLSLDAALTTSTLLGAESVSAAAKAASAAGELGIIAQKLQQSICSNVYCYRGVTRNIGEATTSATAPSNRNKANNLNANHEYETRQMSVSATWVKVLLPALRRIVVVARRAAEARDLFVRLAASGGGMPFTRKTLGSGGSSGAGLPLPLASAAMQIVDAFVVIDCLIKSKPSILVDVRWLQSALELEHERMNNPSSSPYMKNTDMTSSSLSAEEVQEGLAVCSELHNSLLSRPFALIHHLSQSLASLPQELSPIIIKFLIHLLEYASGALASDNIVHGSSSARVSEGRGERHCGARTIAALLILLSPSVTAGEANFKLMRAMSFPGKTGVKLLSSCVSIMEQHRVVHMIGDAFMEPADVLQLSPYFQKHYVNKRSKIHSSNLGTHSSSNAPHSGGQSSSAAGRSGLGHRLGLNIFSRGNNTSLNASEHHHQHTGTTNGTFTEPDIDEISKVSCTTSTTTRIANSPHSTRIEHSSAPDDSMDDNNNGKEEDDDNNKSSMLTSFRNLSVTTRTSILDQSCTTIKDAVAIAEQHDRVVWRVIRAVQVRIDFIITFLLSFFRQH